MKRLSYQHGTVARVARKSGPDVWVLRYYEQDMDGKRTQRATTFSDVRQCPSKAQAEKKAESLRQQIDQRRACALFENLADRYELKGLSSRANTSQTQKSVLGKLREKWTGTRLDWICEHPMDVEEWLLDLQSEKGKDLAYGTRRNIKARLHHMFHMGMKWGLVEMKRNPIDFVDFRSLPRHKRTTRKKVVLTIEQYGHLVNLPTLAPHVRVMVQVAMMTGLGISEVLGLRWEDLDLTLGIMSVRRSVVGRFEDATKTEEREAEVPMHQSLVEILGNWRAEQLPINGWLFGSIQTGRPFWASGLLALHLKPAGRALGIPRLTWHAFRHTYRALLAELELPLEVQQLLMRHSNITTTMGYGKQDTKRTEKLRKANTRVIELIEKQG